MTEFSEETVKPRDIPPNTISNNSNSSSSIGGGSRASVLIAASASYSPNAINIQSSNPADPSYYSANGQGFTASATAYVTAAMFRMVTQTVVSLTASFVARIYAASGASPDLPTGSPLATSEPVTWNEILAMNNSGVVEIPFTFDGTLQLQRGTNYFVCVAATSGSLNTTNYIWTYYSAVNTALNSVRFRNNAWTNNSVTDLYFSVIGSTTSGGGCTCDWNNVPFIHLKGNMYLDAPISQTNPDQFIELCSNEPYEFTAWNSIQEGSIVAFLRTPLSWQIGHNWDVPKSAAIKFTSLKPNCLDGGLYSAYLYLVNFGIGDPNVGIVCSRHLVVRKDFLLNGMVNCVEGAIVLHAGPYRQWSGSPENPAIFTSEDNYHQVDFLKFGSTTDFVPIRVSGVYLSWLEKLPGKSGIEIKSTLLDSNGNSGNSGDVLTSQGGGLAPIWQTPSGSSSLDIKKGNGTTDANGNCTISWGANSFPSGYAPTIVCTPRDSGGRSISIVITAQSNTGFTVKATIATVDGTHKHKVGHVYASNSYAMSQILNVQNETSHVHTYSTTTSNANTDHTHSTNNSGDHNHSLVHNSQNLTTGTTNSHTHSYTDWYVANNQTNNAGSHNHGNTGSSGSSHTHSAVGTTGTTSHTHGITKPGYIRETVLRDSSNGEVYLGGAFVNDNFSQQDIYTENTNVSNTITPVSNIIFNYIAM